MVTPEQRWLETWKKAGPVLERIRQAELKALPATLPPAFCSEPENPFLNAAVRLRQKLMRIHLRQLQQERQAAREEVARLQAELDKVCGEFGTPARST